jgi:hypothetical protein
MKKLCKIIRARPEAKLSGASSTFSASRKDFQSGGFLIESIHSSRKSNHARPKGSIGVASVVKPLQVPDKCEEGAGSVDL